MSKVLKLADDLALPLEAVTETFGVLAARGAGKSNLAAVMAEQMAAAGLPFVVIDPVGSWFGLRAGADGSKGGGLPVPIFGGKHGDVPLERHGGELLADLVVSKRLSCVLDLSTFDSEGTKKAFLFDFARRLYLKNEDPLHLFLEEADDYIPQRPMRDEAQLLRAWENIVRRGRARGLGMTLITQRSASLNKSVLTQVQTLFVLRTTGPQDRAAIEAWVKYHDTDETLLASLSGLGPGEGWVWSPQFLNTMSRHQFHRRRTFDSGATPKNLRGKDAKPAATLADVDLGAIQTQMAATIERAKQDDPKELRRLLAEKDRRIRELERATPPPASRDSAKREVPVLTDADRELLQALREDFTTFSTDIGARAEGLLGSMVNQAKAAIDEAAGRWTAELEKRRGLFLDRLEKTRVQRVLDKVDRVSLPSPNTLPAVKRSVENAPVRQVMPAREPRRPPAGGSENGNVKGGAFRSMLVALAQAGRPLADNQVAARAGMALSGTFDKYLGQQRTAGWVEGSRGALTITDAGLTALGSYDPLPTGRELQDYWLNYVGFGKKREMLATLIAAYPSALSDDEVASRAQMALSGTFDKYLGQLRTLQLVTGSRQALRASAELFG
jgi:hypothetical protein